MIWAHFFCHKNYLCTFFVAKKFAHTFFVAKTICAFFLLQERFRPESFCALKVAIRKDQTFWASGLGHGVEHLLVPRLPREGLFGTHKVRIWHHIFHLLRVEMVMATLPLVVLDVEVINHVLGRHPHLVLGRRQRERFLDQLQWVEVALIKGVTTARQIIYIEKSEL